MAFQMNYTDQYGMNYPESYWRTSEVNANKEEQFGQIVMNGYIDAAQKGNRIIGQKTYKLSAALYTDYCESALASITGASTPRPVTSLQDALIAQSYMYSLSILDTPSTDANGNPINVSFFLNATSV